MSFLHHCRCVGLLLRLVVYYTSTTVILRVKVRLCEHCYWTWDDVLISWICVA